MIKKLLLIICISLLLTPPAYGSWKYTPEDLHDNDFDYYESGAPTDADYLVGTANSDLSGEIVVGTAPGGELGGTWASPTVDSGIHDDEYVLETGDTMTGDLVHETRFYNSTITTFTDGDTTPPVSSSNVFLTANTGATTITDFDSGVAGQTIKIVFGDGNTTLTHGADINLTNAANWTFSTNDAIYFVLQGTTWYEVGRGGGGSGNVTGPGSSTDNAIVRWNGTGGNQVQNSSVIIDDSDNVTGAESIKLADGKKLIFGTGNDGNIYSSSDDLYIEQDTSNKDIIFKINDNGVDQTLMTLDASETAVVIENIAAAVSLPQLVLKNADAAVDKDAYMIFRKESTDKFSVGYDAGTSRFAITAGGSVASASSALTIDASNNLYIPTLIETLTIEFSHAAINTANLILNETSGAADKDTFIKFQQSGADDFIIGTDGSDVQFRIKSGTTFHGAGAININNSDQVGIGTTSIDGILHLDNGASDTDLIIEKDAGTAADIIFHNAGAAAGHIGMMSDEHIYIENDTQDKDIIFKINDGGVDTEVMRIDGSLSYLGIGDSTPATFVQINQSVDNSATVDDPEDTTAGGCMLSITNPNTTADSYAALALGNRSAVKGSWDGWYLQSINNADNDIDFQISHQINAAATKTKALVFDRSANSIYTTTQKIGIGQATPAAAMSVGNLSNTLYGDGTDTVSAEGLNVAIDVGGGAYAASIVNDQPYGSALYLKSSLQSAQYFIRAQEQSAGADRFSVNGSGNVWAKGTFTCLSAWKGGANGGTLVTDTEDAVSGTGFNFSISDSDDYVAGVLNSSGYGHGLLVRSGSASSVYKVLKLMCGSTDTSLFTVYGNGYTAIGQGVAGGTCDGLLHLDGGASTDLIIEKDANGSAAIKFHNAGAEAANISFNSNEDILIENDTQDKDIIFKINDGGVDTEVMRIDGDVSRLGVLIASPDTTLHVNGDTTLGDGTKADGLVVKNVAEVQTTDATQTTVDSVTLLDENTYHIEAWIIGVESDGSNRASYHLAGTFYRTGAGNATQQGSTTLLHAEESDISWAADFTVSGNDVRVSVTGVAATTIEWTTTVKYINMSN